MKTKLYRRLSVGALALIVGLLVSACDSGNGGQAPTTTVAVTEESPTTSVVEPGSTTTPDTTPGPAEEPIVGGVEVPDVGGLRVSDARVLLKDAGFSVEVSTDIVAGEIADLDRVAVQVPAAGEKLAEGGQVVLTRHGLVDVDEGPEAVEIISEQAHDVIVNFMDRINRVGPNSGHTPLSDTDPFAGAVRGTLEMTGRFHDWVSNCYEVGPCNESNWSTTAEGGLEPVFTADQAHIAPYGDGTYYVSAVYAMPEGPVAGYGYLGGFRFYVEDGRAVLFDAATWSSVTSLEGTWISVLSDRAGTEVSVENVADGVDVSVDDTGLRWKAGSVWNMWTALSVTNTRSEVVAPFGVGVAIEGDGAKSWQAHMDEQAEVDGYAAEQYSSVWGRRMAPGSDASVLVNLLFLNKQTGNSQSFVLPVFDGLTSEHLFDLRFSLERPSSCWSYEVEPEVMPAGECISMRRLSEVSDFAGHVIGG